MYTLSFVLLSDDSELSVDSVSSDFLSESSVFSASGSTYVAYVPVVAVVPAALAASSKDYPPASASTTASACAFICADCSSVYV